MIDVHRVSFSYRRRAVFTSLSMRIPHGTRLIMLGPNGAGKTTLLRLLAGELRPQGGELRVAERTGLKHLRGATSLMHQGVAAFPRLTCHEQVAYVGWLGGLSVSDAESRAPRALESVGLRDRSREMTGRLSGGQLRRLGLAEVLIRQTPVVLLDEPTAGLDPGQRRRFRQVLTGLNDDVTVVMSTHETHDVADLFDQVCVIASGGLMFLGSARELLDRTGVGTVEEAYSRLVPFE